MNKTTIKFKNQEITPIANFLGDLKLTNKASRGRTKIIKLLDKKQQEMQGDLDKLRDQFFKKDDNGEFVIQKDDNGGQFYVYIDDSKKVEHQKEVLDIENEEAVINVEEYQQKIKNLYKALEDLDKELSNQDAVVYDTLMDKLDEIFAEKEGE